MYWGKRKGKEGEKKKKKKREIATKNSGKSGEKGSYQWGHCEVGKT